MRIQWYENDFLFLCKENSFNFHEKGFATNLVLKMKVFGTRKWRIDMRIIFYSHASKAHFHKKGFVLTLERENGVLQCEWDQTLSKD